MSSACSFIFMQIKVIFIRMVSHLDSLWNRGTRELGSDLLTLMRRNVIKKRCFLLHVNRFSALASVASYNLGQNLLGHITRIPIFLHSPWQKCLPSQIKRPFSPSPIAMLFAVTQEMHAWAAKPKQHCIRGGEGDEFVSFGHDGIMARNWKLYWNISTVLSGVVAPEYEYGVFPGLLPAISCFYLQARKETAISDWINYDWRSKATYF